MKPIPLERLPRRAMLQVSAIGALALVDAPAGLVGADWTAAEKANVQTVKDFCASFSNRDLDRVMSFLADNCAYRIAETQEPDKGRESVAARIGSYIQMVEKFEVLETWARGPMVFNERQDHFNGGGLKMWHGVGVFFLRDGKIVEWYDYTISMQRA
jgi:limonene-1,2-epoxide hydrolase